MAREPGARARRRPKLRERPGPARASPGAAAARLSPGRGARRGGGRPLASLRPGPSAASCAGPASAAGTVPRPLGRRYRRHLGTPAGSPDLPAHLGSHLRREGGARPAPRGWRGGAGLGGGVRSLRPRLTPTGPALPRGPRLLAHPKMAGEWGWFPGRRGGPFPAPSPSRDHSSRPGDPRPPLSPPAAVLSLRVTPVCFLVFRNPSVLCGLA